MDEPKASNRDTRIQLQKTILSTLSDHKALPTADVASIIDEDRDSVHYQLMIMADVGQIEHRETNNQDVWLTWANAHSTPDE